MLTETFVAATQDPEKATNRTSTGIHTHQLQPESKLESTFKKSSIKPHGLAIGSSHVFAAQADKGVVNVYSRERKNQETVVPFQDKIRSIAIADHERGSGFLLLGTESGALLVWQLSSGRQISTPKHHLKAITCIAVDLNSEFVLSGSADTNIHLWALPKLIAFQTQQSIFDDQSPRSPRATLTRHKGEITDVKFGHTVGQNDIAVSIAKDALCIIWDALDGSVLHLFLLPSTPLCLDLDPADRAAYIGLEDGSIQLVDFYKKPSTTNTILAPDNLDPSTQAHPSDKWTSPETTSPALCIAVSYDGTLVLTGHHDGANNLWTVAGGRLIRTIATFDAPVTNLQLLPPTGFANEASPPLKLDTVTKPRYETDTTSARSTAQGWAVNMQITSDHRALLPDEKVSSEFTEALTHPSLPASMINAVIPALRNDNEAEDSVANADLKAQNEALTRSLEEERQTIKELKGTIGRRKREDEVKAARKRKRRERVRKLEERERRVAMGEKVGDVAMEEVNGDEEGLSSDTDELTDE